MGLDSWRVTLTFRGTHPRSIGHGSFARSHPCVASSNLTERSALTLAGVLHSNPAPFEANPKSPTMTENQRLVTGPAFPPLLGDAGAVLSHPAEHWKRVPRSLPNGS